MTPQNLYSPAVVDLEIRHGQPVLPGTHISIAIIIGSLAGGMTLESL